MVASTTIFSKRGACTNAEVNALHAEAFHDSEWNWVALTRRHSLGWVVARQGAELAKAAGCEYLHVDFDEQLSPFCLGARGFVPTSAGLLALDRTGRRTRQNPRLG
jgi:hypothetical protein